MCAIINTRLKREANFIMIAKKLTKNWFRKVIFGCLFAMMGAFGLMAFGPTNNVYADPPTGTPTVTEQTQGVSCEDSLGSLGWLVCPTTGKISEAVDWLYKKIEDILVIQPVEMKDGSPIYEIWKYARGVTNIVFIILFLVVIYSQLTGVGISNYGIKKILPKMIVVAILVNLSFIICSLAVDVSNIVGNSLRGLFASIEESTMATMDPGMISGVSMSEMYSSMAGGAALAVGAGVIAFETGSIWMLIPVVLGAIVAVASGLITIALRQAVVALLIMVSPLAIVAYMLPNTEDLFKRWKKLLTQMLVFYPMFSLLFGASNLAGWAIITSAKDGFGLMLGVAVQIFPLFFSWSLMKMSGTFLSTINGKIQSLAARPLATNRAWADSRRQLTRQKTLSSGRAYTPSARLMQFMSDRRVARDEETKEHAESVRLRGQAYAAMRNYKKDGTPSAEGEESYELQARNIRYQRTILRHKNNMNKGMGQLEAVKNRASVAQKARLNALDAMTIKEADALFTESARGEMIERRNAEGRYNRFEAAMNVHMDDVNGYKYDPTTGARIAYKFHFDSIEAGNVARERYDSVKNIMEGEVLDAQYAAASAAQAFDTQAKIINTKFQKYFELAPPTKDVEYRLREFSQKLSKDPNFKVSSNIDSIIAGLRVVNMRGDTDIVKNIMDDILDKQYGGLKLGTHASQALASFLMFEVKDNDPFLRRFGKYINLETARIYNSNDRKTMDVTYDEYVKGYHDEPDGTRMYAKKDMKKLVEGTSLDNIERTALSNLDESLKKAYGYDASDSTKKWDVEGWLRKREEVQTAFEPAFLSSSLKWLSGSEQINSGVKFWTGYELKQQKNEDGSIKVDENGDPVYDLSPSWKGKEFAGHEDEVEKYFRRKTMDYFKDQTTGQILGMRTDYREPTMEHLLKNYLESSSEEEPSDERKRKYEEARAEIQSRYSDKTAEEAQKLRAKDLKKLKMELAGRQVRKILGETGKLKQIYRTRTSGTAINAKDWLRGWVNLDNEEALREEIAFYEEERKRQREEANSGADSGEDDSRLRIYSEDDKERFLGEMQNLKDKIMDDETEVFFEETLGQLEDWFGEGSIIAKKYDKYYHEENKYADNIELYGFLKELLDDLDNYPDA